MGYLELEDGKLYYEEAGQGEALILSHAGFVDSGMWDAQWEAFTQYYRVIRFDMRGFGKSSIGQTPISRRQDLLNVMNQLNIERATLLGCSLSGEVILDFALEHPERTAALIVVSAVPSGFEMQGEPPRYLMEMMQAAQASDLEQASELQLRIWVDGMYREPNQVNPHVRKQAKAMNALALQGGGWMNEEVQPLDPPAVKRLDEIQVPTLVIAGALDHPETLRGAAVMAAEIEGAKQMILPDTAHMLNMEQPEAFNEVVLDFVAGVS